jgi:hypothetical protein
MNKAYLKLKFKKSVFLMVHTNINSYIAITQNENLHYKVFLNISSY